MCGVFEIKEIWLLMCILYMNDICHTSKLLNTILFADNTPVFYSDNKNLSALWGIMNNKLKEVCNCLKANKLSLNAKKTNFMFLDTSKQTSNKDNENKYLSWWM